MRKAQRRIVVTLSAAVMKRLRRSRSLIAAELPELIAKDQQLYDAMREATTSGALRRAIHSSKILLPDLAKCAGTDIDTHLDQALEMPKPSDEDCRRYFASNARKYAKGERVHLRKKG